MQDTQLEEKRLKEIGKAGTAEVMRYDAVLFCCEFCLGGNCKANLIAEVTGGIRNLEGC